MGQPRPLFCLFSFLSNTIFYRKNFSGIRTRIVWVEGEHADHLRPPRSSPAFVCYLIFVQMKIEKDLRWKDSAPIWRSIVRSFVGAIFKISPTLYQNEADTRSVWPDWAQFCQLCKILRCWQSFYALLSIWQNFVPTLAKKICCWANFNCFKMAKCWRNNLGIWSHCSRCQLGAFTSSQ